MIGDAMPIQNTAFDASRLFADPVSWSVCCSLRTSCLLRATNATWRCTVNPENTVLTSAEVTEVEVGVVTTVDDQGNRMTLSLSPSRTWQCVHELEGILRSQNRMIRYKRATTTCSETFT